MPPDPRMERLYHLMPEPLVGDALLSFNRLAETHPEAAARHRAKYAGREAFLARPMPPLGCLWNDVIHLSPVHPMLVRDALLKTGHRWPRAGRPVAVVDTERIGITAQNTALWLSPPGPRPLLDAAPKDFAPFDLAALARHRAVPPQTWGHYRAFRERAARPFLFHGIAHVLHRGAIPLDAIETIRV